MQRIIPLETGEELILEQAEPLYAKLREVYGLGDSEVPSDELVKEFLLTVMQKAVANPAVEQ
jgi:hypothetical protein